METNGKKMLDEFELGNELSTMVAEGKITSRIAEKIKEKVKEKNIKLSKEKLYELIDILNSKLRSGMQASRPTPPGAPAPSPSHVPPPGRASSDENATKELLEELHKLHERIEKIENAQKELMKAWSTKVKMVKSEEIKVPEEMTGEKIEIQVTPLYTIPNDPESVVVVMKWLQFLVDKVGKGGVQNVLDYYVDIGWISEEAKIKLLEYCEGLMERKGAKESSPSTLVAKDHVQSFLFIQKLKGEKIDEYFVNKIERDLSKLMKNLENLSLH
ncbi:MAG TPA: hypothetical protein ENG74_00940 [Thermoplasmatales archaeon]|nr:hypothetical protein [Thermoplasmatales archaeon]